VALILANPLRLAAIDAGSNAFRLIIAHAHSAEDWEIVETARAPVRLGHSAFSAGKLDRGTLRAAASAFRQFRRRMDRHGVAAYRAVATSAAREARNRHLLVERIQREANIVLDVISGEEEARLVRVAVFRALRGMELPRFILDLGGGSLEVSELRGGIVHQSLGLPLGTVRLMEAFRVRGTIHENVLDDMQRHIQVVLRSLLPNRPRMAAPFAVACGGNVDTLSGLSSGPRLHGLETMNTRLLQDRLWQIVQLDVEGRMNAFQVRRDRAEVMGVAAIVLTTIARWLGLRTMITPRVGVREGLLQELAARHMALGEPTPDQRKRAQIVVAGAEAFACKVRCDLKHGEQVRRLALLLFDQLWPYHRMTFELRAVLEAAATLHDCGHFVHRKAHHRHGEYLVRYTKIAGMRGWTKHMTASLVRYHSGKSDPTTAHKSFASLNRARRKKARVLAGILRVAERLENDHRQAITGLTIEGGPRDVRVRLDLRDGTRLNLSGIERKARLLERELKVRLSFHRALPAQNRRVA
jgi:exopolyphosphatase / guanosine-5'-triphosphate,3'-diphosphate pyrophosphatase